MGSTGNLSYIGHHNMNWFTLKTRKMVEILLNILKLIIQISILFLVYYCGVWIQQYFQLFIPGSVIGLILLFVLLTTGIFQAKWIKTGANFMNNHLVLFFIPATVGFINYYQLFKGKGMLLVVITIVSTILVMISSGLTSQALAKRRETTNE